MCGLAGFVSELTTLDTKVILRRMTDAILHRGPDDGGSYETNTGDSRWCVGLGHRRLSIIDLDTGHQPLGNEDGSIQVVFNGEIYNFHGLRDELIAHGHRFRTASDTETIVHAYEEYGDECVTRFRGMFAFALWDGPRERLLLARDRFGKKPLYLRQQDGELFFASEIKAILAAIDHAPGIDHEAVWAYLAFRYVPGPRTLFDGIVKLGPGCCALWERGELRQWRYYRPPDHEPRIEMHMPADPVGGFLDVLDDAVRVRMVSDVPFGAFLSGGLDSSAVVGLMARHSALPVKTFSVGFRESGYSELPYARTIAKQFGTEHHELTVSQDDLMDYLPALVRFRDAPVAEPSDIPIYLLACEARKTVKMVLTGEGSDELLGGYPKHVFEPYVSYYQWLPSPLRAYVLEPLVRALPYRFRRAKTAVFNLGMAQWNERMARWFGALTPAERQRLCACGWGDGAGWEVAQFDSPAANTSLRRILYFDQTSWLPDNLLERGDRMTMAASIEARMPFMDHQLAMYISALPDRFRVRGRQTKWILREGMKRLLPAAILERPKVGFRVPVNEWFRGPMHDYLREHLVGPASITRDYYHRQEIERILADHVQGRQNHEKLLWTLLTLEIWHREYARPA
jgi:asparagine synthase (glutamine-hydrolysing)